MPDYSIREGEEQALKAAAYFGKLLAEHREGFLAAEIDGVTLVVARGKQGVRLKEAVTGGVFQREATIHRPSPQVVLVPMFHAPPPEHATKVGHVHLHVLSDVKLGRRERRSGECLCAKRKGTDERVPDGETKMCASCVKIAADNGLSWSLD